MSASTYTFPQQLFSRPISLSLAWCLTNESATKYLGPANGCWNLKKKQGVQLHKRSVFSQSRLLGFQWMFNIFWYQYILYYPRRLNLLCPSIPKGSGLLSYALSCCVSRRLVEFPRYIYMLLTLEVSPKNPISEGLKKIISTKI